MKFLKKIYTNLFNFISLFKSYYYDFIKFYNSSTSFKKPLSIKNFEALLTIHYHSIEKGLSYENIRLGFGKKALDNLFLTLHKYKIANLDINNERYQDALRVLDKYIDFHISQKFNVEDIINKRLLYPPFKFENNNLGAKFHYFDFKNKDYHSVVLNRRSIRLFDSNYSNESIRSQILKAIKLAENTPSFCNRQSWKTNYITDKKLINTLLLMQGGISGFIDGINHLLVVSTTNEYLGGPRERNQGYIDGGLYSMNLLLSLTFYELATCCLNNAFNIKVEQKVKNILNLNKFDNLIMFIIVGSPQEKNKIAFSRKYNSK